ncbi:alpha/beta hydrolase [Rhodobacteraceae bacterium XHP0102]|nr:alpha/beta hydrolase [Rhodobacteraceae bacterium XHP0102]
MAHKTRFFITGDNVHLAYDDTGGEGAALLCLPGLTRNRADFDFVLRDFRDQARIIRLDFRGRGASDHADPATYTPLHEASDVVALLDHLALPQAAILGTSRGGIVAMIMGLTARDRLSGVCFNDIGPEIMPEGLDAIMTYLGKQPSYKTLAEAAAAMPAAHPEFQNVPSETWAAHVARLWREDEAGLHLRYDPRLREAVAPAFAPDAKPVDLWPCFDALAPLPLALIRGAGSNILSRETADKMRARRPDMIYAELPDRGHVPFLDEPASQAVISQFLKEIA